MMNKTAIYCRLSREDENDGLSTSIINQQHFLQEYAIKNNLDVVDIYVDDGYSGGNFNRPGFKRLIEDIEKNKIDMVLVKDLSRLGRNYLEVGYYTEEYFPLHQIRFIAVNDNYDSINGEDDFTPFKNIINQWYLKDLSKKVKTVHEARMKKGILPQGKFIPLFGYQYNDSNERIIDPDSSKVVKKVFELYNKGYSIKKIKEELINYQMVTPSYYNYQKYNYNPEYWLNADNYKKYDWNHQVINRIISNKEYTGILELKKRETVSYKTHKRRVLKNEEKYVFDNRFPAIISQETFNKALLLRNGKIHSSKYEDDLFYNLVVCGNCHKPLSYIKSGNNLYLGCRRKSCLNPSRINYQGLLNIIKIDVNSYFNQLIKFNDLEKIFHNLTIHKEDKQKRIMRNKKIDELIIRLHQEYLESNISNELFVKIKNKYLNEKEQNNHFLNEIIDENNFVLFYDFITEKLGINQLLKILVDHIEITNKKTIKVYYKRLYEDSNLCENIK